MDKPDSAVSDPSAAFARFKQALRHIVSVSKDELKRREEAYQRTRKAKRRTARHVAEMRPE